MLDRGGYFISFEGGEGAGKSTQIHYLARHLRKMGFDVVVTREPGGTAGAEAVRYILLNTNIQNYGPVMEAVLLTAARIDHMNQLILPALDAGKIVLCDRFIDSTRVYQGSADRIQKGYISFLEKIAIGNRIPDLTFILDIPAKEGMSRVRARRSPIDTVDHFEKADNNIQENRRQAFLNIARMEPERCYVIDATRSPEVIACEIAETSDQKIRKMDEFCNATNSI